MSLLKNGNKEGDVIVNTLLCLNQLLGVEADMQVRQVLGSSAGLGGVMRVLRRSQIRFRLKIEDIGQTPHNLTQMLFFLAGLFLPYLFMVLTIHSQAEQYRIIYHPFAAQWNHNCFEPGLLNFIGNLQPGQLPYLCN